MEAPAHVGTHRQLVRDSIMHRKPVKFTQHRRDVIKLVSGSCHNMRCFIVNYLQLLWQTVVDTVQQTAAVIQPAADERVRKRLRGFFG